MLGELEKTRKKKITYTNIRAHDMYGERLCNLQYTDALRGSEVTVGGGCGPSGPSSSTATHLYCAPFSAFVGVTTKMEDT